MWNVKLVILLVIAAVTVGLGLGFYLLARHFGGNQPGLSLSAGALGVLLALYLLFFHLFPETGPALLRGRSQTEVQVRIQPETQGLVYLFFDPALPRVQAGPEGVVTLSLPESGRLLSGYLPGQEKDNVDLSFEVVYEENGRKVQLARLNGDRGSHNQIFHVRFFVGTQAEHDQLYQSLAPENYWNEQIIYQELKAAQP